MNLKQLVEDKSCLVYKTLISEDLGQLPSEQQIPALVFVILPWKLLSNNRRYVAQEEFKILL